MSRVLTEEEAFWNRVSDYERRFLQEDFRGRPVAAALALRREAEDMFADLAEFAGEAGDTDDDSDYVRWLQRVGDDITSRITLALGAVKTPEEAEQHLSFAFAILREVARDALSRKPS